jgi:hypothetical protein
MSLQAEPIIAARLSVIYSNVLMDKQERTVSSASAYEERTVAPAGARGSRGALFCTSCAICTILRREEEVESCPNEIAWNDNGFLSDNQPGPPTAEETIPTRGSLLHDIDLELSGHLLSIYHRTKIS